MRGVFFAPFAVFFERQFPLHIADVFMRPVIIPLAHRTLESDEIWLGHDWTARRKEQIANRLSGLAMHVFGCFIGPEQRHHSTFVRFGKGLMACCTFNRRATAND